MSCNSAGFRKRKLWAEEVVHPEEKIKELQDKYTRAFWRIKKATDIGAFVVSRTPDEMLRQARLIRIRSGQQCLRENPCH